jgi:glycerophosphoryl diester phosphodiesterase
VWTLDCGSKRLDAHPGQQTVPGVRMPLLSQVFDLVDCFEARRVWMNIETKVEAGAPEETAPREQFVQIVAREVRDAGMLDRVTIQSFDWGALIHMRKVEPRLPIVALTNRDFLETGEPGASPWLGGIDIDDFGGSLVDAAASFGADAISPVHGFPQNGKVTDPDYEPYTTPEMVADAHEAGLAVVPWTIDDKPTMHSLIDAGVDGIITDYPDRLREVMAERGMQLPSGNQPPGDRNCVTGTRIPLARAHAHNDYEHDRPLFDALDHGFKSAEADVWLVGGELLVAHDLVEVRHNRTLQSLYLDPLSEIVERNGGSVYPSDPHYFHLLIDIKSEAETTYRKLHRVLGRYRAILTRFTPEDVREGAVTAVVSGNRSRATMEAQEVRYAAYDGRLSDLESSAPSSFIPLISDNWTNNFSWEGEGPMPEAELQKLRDIVAQAHAAGRRVRFWATPDAPGSARQNLWSVLLHEGVDYVNTDDLDGLQRFLLDNDQRASQPHVTF